MRAWAGIASLLMPVAGVQVEALVVVDKRVGAMAAPRRWLRALASELAAVAWLDAGCVVVASVGPGVQRAKSTARLERLGGLLSLTRRGSRKLRGARVADLGMVERAGAG